MSIFFGIRRASLPHEGRMTKDQAFCAASFVLRPLSVVSPLNNRLGTLGKLAAWHQYLATAGEAAHPDVCAQPDHAPLVAAAGMYLAHSNYVFKPNVSGINHK